MTQPSAPHDITEMLRDWQNGNRDALDRLMPLVHAELHRQAANYLRRERAHHTLQATALINEAYLRLIDQRNVEWQNRAHFYGIAAQAMRRILVDYARSKQREKRGGEYVRTELDEATMLEAEGQSIDLIALDEALNKLGRMDDQKAKIVELRYFSGLSVEETAEVLKLSTKTIERNWTMAKAWLHRELK